MEPNHTITIDFLKQKEQLRLKLVLSRPKTTSHRPFQVLTADIHKCIHTGLIPSTPLRNQGRYSRPSANSSLWVWKDECVTQARFVYHE